MIHTIQRNDPNIRLNFEKSVENLIRQNFKDSRYFSVIAEIRKYKSGEEASIRNQVMGREPRRVEVYFKGEYLCDIRENMSREKGLALINFRLLQILGGNYIPRDNHKIYVSK